MKRIFLTLSLAVIVCLNCSCGGKPQNTSDAMYQIGLNALAAADKYIAGEITGEEADELLDEYCVQASAQYDSELEEIGSDTLIGSEYENDYSIKFEITTLSFDIMMAKHGNGAMSDVMESRDSLADVLGE